ncbi:MAG: glycosyltransferase family 4 protein [Planctomycetota bacterium]
MDPLRSGGEPGGEPLRIGIDTSALAKKERTGIARYVGALVDAMADLDVDDTFRLCYRLSRVKRLQYFHRVRKPNFGVRVFQEGFTPLLERRLDVFHGPDARIPRLGSVPCVATVHDVFSLDSAEFAEPGFREKKAKAYSDLAEHARMLLFVSSHSRDRFLEHHPLPENRVRVVHEGVDAGFGDVDDEGRARVRKRLGLPERYLLWVGQIATRKNPLRTLEALSRLPDDTPPLVMAGPAKDAAAEVEDAIARLGLGDRVLRPGHVAEEDLAPLYSEADVFLFPSLDEGFGLPLLESFACGTPVLASTAGALPETAGGAALLVDPLDVDAIADGVRRLLDDGDLRADLVAKGRSRAAAMTWEETARRTLQIYREALE